MTRPAQTARYTCGHCGQGFDTQGAKRRHKHLCDAPRFDTPAGKQCDAEDMFGPRPKPPKWLVEDARRQWDAIPTHPTEIAAWMRGEPINPIREPVP
jgi:hypothetical protein